MTPYWSNGVATLHQADARAIPLPDGSVHCCITSPPYWGLRDYGLSVWDGGDPECGHVRAKPDYEPPNGEAVPHAWGHWQEAWPGGVCGHCGATQQAAGIGLEPTLSDWLANIVAVSREVWRVLRDDGTYWLNLGDCLRWQRQGAFRRRGFHNGDKQETNAGSVGVQPITRGKRTDRGEGSGRWGMGDTAVDGLPAKNLMGQPWRAAFALQDDGWILRSRQSSGISPTRCRSRVSDRPTSAYEMVFLLTKRAHYFYDAEAIRQPYAASVVNDKRGNSNGHRNDRGFPGAPANGGTNLGGNANGGSNARNVWQIPTQGRPEAHFATFPDELPRRCILAGTSEHGVCADCGAPWARQTDSETIDTRPKSAGRNIDRVGGMSRGENFNNGDIRRGVKHTQTVGWQPTCECGPCEYHRLLSEYRRAMDALEDVWSDADPPDMPQLPTGECTHPPRIPATVLDPFVGSGTTIAVAQQLGRHGIGLDLNPDYLAIAAKRLTGITLPLGIGL